MKYLSVCSGIEAASVAWRGLGWQCVGVSEIEPFACAVLAERYPSVPNYGNLEDYRRWEIKRGAVDLLVGGTPCQSFSGAGLRQGLDDPRGNLALVYLGLVDRIRPRWVVWENVPGVLSVDKGRPFGAFIGGLAQLGYGFAWRVLDAQFVRVDGYERAVPQRRRRLFVVGCLGNWRASAEVLLEQRSCAQHPAASKEAWPATSRGAGSDPRNPSSVGLVASSLIQPAGGRHNNLTKQTICFDMRNITSPDNRSNPQAGDPSPPLYSHTTVHCVVIKDEKLVRRLTPRESERLQGFPDDWTLITYRGKPAKDGPRYRAIGNSMACNVMRWIGRRIELVESILQPAPAQSTTIQTARDALQRVLDNTARGLGYEPPLQTTRNGQR